MTEKTLFSFFIHSVTFFISLLFLVILFPASVPRVSTRVFLCGSFSYCAPRFYAGLIDTRLRLCGFGNLFSGVAHRPLHSPCPVCCDSIATPGNGGRINVYSSGEACCTVNWIDVSIRPNGCVFRPVSSPFSLRSLPVVCLTAFMRASCFRLSTNSRLGSPASLYLYPGHRQCPRCQ
jgi:hypothetical protein